MFDILKKTGLTQVELAAIFGVSRVTMNKYINGGNPHALILTKVNKLLAAFKRAVADKKLPIDPATPKTHKIKAVRALLAQYLAA